MKNRWLPILAVALPAILLSTPNHAKQKLFDVSAYGTT
jgi:hypothetical protein